ncbi:MAG: sigma-54 dependent transcriptional regulator [Thermodesulfobacteriota bacterium]
MRVDENEFYRQASMQICGSLEIEKAMWRCLLYINQFIPASDMALYLTEHGLGAIRMVARATVNSGEKVNIIIPLPPEARAALSGSLLPDIRIVNRPEEDPVVRPGLEYLGLPQSSFIIMFLVTEGQRMGSAAAVLRVEGRERYYPQHLHLFSLLNEPFVIALSNYLSHLEVLKLKDFLADDNRYLYQELQRNLPSGIIGADFGLKKVMERVRQVAPQKSAVLLYGETGVGKEIIADAIHRHSPRADGPYIKVNCGAIPPTLLDSELFGHEKGAFSGATSEKRGRFERAHKGTIFLDEVGELTPEAQLRFLRVLQNKEVERLGGSRVISVDIRVIAATHRHLEQMVRVNQFREDLWFRLNVVPIYIPPLRERIEDIPALVQYFLGKKAKELGLAFPPELAPRAIDLLLKYPWPGNVRELENVVERALILNRGEPITFNELNVASRSGGYSQGANALMRVQTLNEWNASYIRQVLNKTNGRISGPQGCAALLGIKPNTLRHRMAKLGIPYGRKRRQGQGPIYG